MPQTGNTLKCYRRYKSLHFVSDSSGLSGVILRYIKADRAVLF
ncbi:hypothetical protein RNAN_2303 [Rheinheimera nanhaiensis E407-8]|uniref:Uncharacterized protein n=1 Tax=Rheinheimera nanhaiensis E407-8 TaxID=562729 RepID=I1DZ30_9GAMM|nr:hypothetical protein RNAN_2303 [Rheinheimera nanhaiensis E407-8]